MRNIDAPNHDKLLLVSKNAFERSVLTSLALGVRLAARIAHKLLNQWAIGLSFMRLLRAFAYRVDHLRNPPVV